MNRLDELAKKYGSDKSSLLHGYTDIYQDLFERRETVGLVVEIGVQRGGSWKNNHPTPSLKMWQEYYYNANVIGFDLKQIDIDEPNITLIRGDQSKKRDLNRLINAMPSHADLILDDGSHRPEDQLFTFEHLREHVAIGGYYIIEDCNARVQKEYHESKRIHARLTVPDGWVLAWEDSKKAGKQSLAILQRLK
jgi:cephalosporin hydroxylase